jgi:hypothetical protein
MNDGKVLFSNEKTVHRFDAGHAEPGETSEMRMWKMTTRTPPTRESPPAPPMAEERLTSTCRPCPTT